MIDIMESNQEIVNKIYMKIMKRKSNQEIVKKIYMKNMKMSL